MIRNLYVKFRDLLPPRLGGLITKIVFKVLRKPFVKASDVPSVIRFSGNYKGGIIISADFELGWAFRYSKTNSNPEKMASLSRKNIPFLLKIFELYNIPITWATVGHLFLNECKKGDHDWLHRIPYFENKHWLFDKGDWFDCDPYTSWENAKSWYAPDLIESILNSRVKHEIGCHTFSHIDFSYENCPPEVAEDEIKACVYSAKRWGITLKSMVFPGGTFGNLEVLKKYGFQIYRKNMNFDMSYPFKNTFGLLVTPSSAGLGDYGFGWSIEYFLKRYKKYIDKAINTGTVCHFWLHPSIDEWFLKRIFPDILKYAAEKREAGKLWIGTMSEIANYINRVR